MAYLGYAGGYAEIESYLGDAVAVGTGEADTLTAVLIETWMRRVDDTIDTTLNQVYFTPLQKITRPNRDGGTITKYPDPIPRISVVLTAAALLRQKFKDVNPSAMPESVIRDEEEMKLLLSSLVNNIGPGSTKLDGQKFKARNRFVSPSIVPSTPTTPTAGPTGTLGV